MRHLLLFLLILYIPLQCMFAQQMQLPTNIQSPNAASLGKYGDMPVSYFTGTANVSIPLTILNVKGFELPISLNYDASGIRINNHPGWVGQNWSLSAGGVITRTVKGAPDEWNNGASGYSIGYGENKYLNYFESSHYLLGLDYSSKTVLQKLARERMTVADYEPDIFTFNFLGFSGKFYWGNDNTWKVSSDQNIEILSDPTSISAYCQGPFSNFPNEGFTHKYDFVLKGFKIRDDKGNTYEFGYNELDGKSKDAIEYSMSFFDQSNIIKNDVSWVANAWYLTKITDKYGVEIYSLTYKRAKLIAEMYRAEGGSGYSVQVSEAGVLPYGNCSSGIGAVANTNNFNGDLILPTYLSEISSAGRSLVSFSISKSVELNYTWAPNFMDIQLSYIPTNVLPYYYLEEPTSGPFYNGNTTYNPFLGCEWQELTRIVLPNKNILEFVYNNKSNERLNLNAINLYSNSTDYYNKVKSGTYNFIYNKFESLPNEYCSFKTDHWGFYKGPDCSLSPLSNHYITRETNPDYLQIGILNYIYYPTGGYTKLEYEPHTYSQVVNDSYGLDNEIGVAGGLRIRKITDFDGTKETWKEFKYVRDYELNHASNASSGLLTAKPKYYWKDYYRDGYTITSWWSPSVTIACEVFSINPLVPLSNSFGSHIGYSTVAEVRQDGSYTIYNYTNHSTNPNLVALNSLNPASSRYDSYCDKSLERGKLISKKVYDKSNVPVQESNYTYRTDNPSLQKFVLASNCNLTQYCNGNYNYYSGGIYKVYYYSYDIISESVTNYLNGKSINETTNYLKRDVNYINGDYRLISSITKVGSDGDLESSNLLYPIDLPTEPYMSKLIDNYRVGEVIATTSTKSLSNMPIGATKYSYRLENGLYYPANFQTSTSDFTGLSTELYYDKYDAFGNLLQYHTRNGVNTSLIWGYNSQLMVAKCENTVYSQLQPFVGNIQNLSNSAVCTDCQSLNDFIASVKGLRSSLSANMITSYSYLPQVGVSSITDVNSLTTSYKYDGHGRLKSVFDNDNNVINEINYHNSEQISNIVFNGNEFRILDYPEILNLRVSIGYSDSYSISLPPWITLISKDTNGFNVKIIANNTGSKRNGSVVLVDRSGAITLPTTQDCFSLNFLGIYTRVADGSFVNFSYLNCNTPTTESFIIKWDASPGTVKITACCANPNNPAQPIDFHYYNSVDATGSFFEDNISNLQSFIKAKPYGVPFPEGEIYFRIEKYNSSGTLTKTIKTSTVHISGNY